MTQHHTAIDGLEVPQGDGTKDAHTIQRSLEVEMEQVIATLVTQEQRVRRCGRREAYVRVIAALRRLTETP